MAYERADQQELGFRIPAAEWNKTIVDNVTAIKALTAVNCAVVKERLVAGQYLPPDVWNTRLLNSTQRDPDSIIKNEDYANYRFDLSDGDYWVEIFVQSLGYTSGSRHLARLRDIDNSLTICATNDDFTWTHYGGSVPISVFNYTFFPFTLSNGSDTTFELQSLTENSGQSYNIGNMDTDNSAENGVWDSMLKFWKVA